MKDMVMGRGALVGTLLLGSACVGKVNVADLPEDTDGTSETDGTDTNPSGSSQTASSTEPTHGGTESSSATFTGGSEDTGMVEPGNAVDILFVIDNSGSMGSAQAGLAAGMSSMVGALDAAGADWRIAVTTTDNGNPWCQTNSAAGNFVASSCRSRLNDFVFQGAEQVDVTEEACLNVCGHEDLGIVATAVDDDPEPKPRPWLQGGAEPNFAGEIPAAEALSCLLPQGINGCGFEAPMESMFKAISRTQKLGEDEYGFLRDEAHLIVVVISDEVDCSHNHEFNEIFLPDGLKTFWSNPDDPSPTSAVCWNAGVECSGGPGTYDECHAVDLAEDGSPVANSDNAVLHPVSRYRDQLATLASMKPAGATVSLFGIVGVPPGYADDGAEISYKDSMDPIEQDSFGIGPGCVAGDIAARPPVRIREVAEGLLGERALYSICDGDLSPSLVDIVDRVTGG